MCIGKSVVFLKGLLTFSLCLLCTLGAQGAFFFDDFSDGNTTSDLTWYLSGGSFTVDGSNRGNNNNSTANQFITTSFVLPRGLVAGDTMSVEFSYGLPPTGTANVNTMRAGFFEGDAVTSSGFNQFSSGQPTRDWTGYSALVDTDGSGNSSISFNDNSSDDHAFFNGTSLGTGGAVNTDDAFGTSAPPVVATKTKRRASQYIARRAPLQNASEKPQEWV